MSNEIRTEYLHLERRWRQRFDVLVVLAALATIPIVILQEKGVEHSSVIATDWFIWAAFLAEFLFGLVTARQRPDYARREWLSVAVVVLSFPLLPDLLASVRVVRVTRVLRLVRILAVTGRGLRAMRTSLAGQSLMYVAALTTLLTFSAAALLTVVEGETANAEFADSLWWAIVTVTTVGYGDIAPATPVGRLLAVVLMLCGLGLISTLAASISAYFVGSDSDKALLEIKNRLARIERLLEESNNASRTGRSNREGNHPPEAP